MKIKFKRLTNGEFQSGIYRGNGGISSMIKSRVGSFLYCLGIFNPKSIFRALTW